MKQYASIDNLWYDAVRSLLRTPMIKSRDGECAETLAYSALLVNTEESVLRSAQRKLSHRYAAAELLWYMSGSNHGDLITKFAPQYARFLVDGVAEGGYGPRLFPNDGATSSGAVVDVIKELRRNRNSRRAYISVFQSQDLSLAISREVKDVPCTIGLQFFIRKNQLDCIATMRSNDVWLGMPYDIFAFTQIQRLIAAQLMVGVGWYCHQVGSLHLYERNHEAAATILPEWEAQPFNKAWSVPHNDETRGGLDTLHFLYMLGSEALGALTDAKQAWRKNCPDAFNHLVDIVDGSEKTL